MGAASGRASAEIRRCVLQPGSTVATALIHSPDSPPSFTALIHSPHSQPGSTVATSLVEGEGVAKHVALLSLCGDQWQMTPLPLTTVRPFIIREVTLDLT